MTRPQLDEVSLSQLKTSLLYCKTGQLKEFLECLGLPEGGKKNDLIERIVKFMETGEIITLPEIPSPSKAIKGELYPLAADTKILKGSYKNDLSTRNFFKSLIGPHFHFTAFGVDWINERWLKGNPPTYQEYADMWQDEYQRRKTAKANPKEEWAYINFVQSYLSEHPKCKKSDLLNTWRREQDKHYLIALRLISDLFQNDL